MVSRDEVLSPLLVSHEAFSWSTAGTSACSCPVTRYCFTDARISAIPTIRGVSSLLDYVRAINDWPGVTAQPRASSRRPKPGTARSSKFS